ncbi:hypothetical protein [Streptomyces justiciae]|uniref:Uncharacterized protein n=1 Tax=Streptomyces justiciae TaxID=2780140 RepID=A0ABU3M991_9ACTN|nr:hypothetical protein [Streptomyces justiciae]MDT7847943.1 hypothetical protein [Streptomyces justiciae]
MAAARKPVKSKLAKCPTCHGTGEVSRTVHVGRKRRPVGQQTGLCLNCLGSGQSATN